MFVKVQLGISTVYMLVSLFLTTSFAMEFWSDWSFTSLAPQAFAYGFSWPSWMLA
jgi:hypothetical protein